MTTNDAPVRESTRTNYNRGDDLIGRLVFGENKPFKVGQLVELMNPSFQFQLKQGILIQNKFGATLQTRQFGRLVERNGGHYYVRPIINGRLASPKEWLEEAYENEMRHVSPRLNPYDKKIRKFDRSHLDGKKK